MNAKWYRVVAVGPVGSGPVRCDPEAAWAAWFAQARRDGLTDNDIEQFTGQCRTELVAATTRRAALDADISCTQGTIGSGCWWVCGDAS